MGGGGLYDGLPHPHPTTSYWQSPPSYLANHRTTVDLPDKAEYVIVGSGITGASIATKILQRQPEADVVILEARTVCSGATGRNGGHCRAGFWDRFKGYLEQHGTEEALKFEKFELDNVRNVTDFIRAEGIDCDLNAVEAADLWLDEKDFQEALENVKARDKLRQEGHTGGLEHRVYLGEEAKEYFQIAPAAGGVAFDGFTMWPYKFVCALLERVIGAGGNLQTTTPVLSVARDDDEGVSSSSCSHPWLVKTERGTIAARHAILASNAYTGAIYRPLGDSGFLVPTRAQVVAMRPGSRIAGDRTLERSCGINPHGLGDYMHARPAGMQGAGDVIYGGGRDLSDTHERHTVDDSTLHPGIAEYLRRAAPRYYGPELWGQPGRVLMEWTGIMGYTEDGLPLIGEVPGQKGLWICAGFNGHGMALTFQSAEALVETLFTGEKPAWLPKMLSADRAFK